MKYQETQILWPEQDTIDRWKQTRKHPENAYKQYGQFRYPGYYTLQGYKEDRTFFLIAIIAELLFLATLPFVIGGVDIYLGIAASFLVLIDFIGAFFAHVGQAKISDAKKELSVHQYKQASGIQVDLNAIRSAEQKIRNAERSASRLIGKSLIIIGAIAKVLGMTVVAGGFGAIPLVILVLYGFLAYIHIRHTGFFYSGFSFKNKLKRDYRSMLNGYQANPGNRDTDNPNNITELTIQGAPVGMEFKPIYNTIIDDHIAHTIDQLYPQKGQDGTISWQIRKWSHHFWDDERIEQFVNANDNTGTGLSNEARAFLFSYIIENLDRLNIRPNQAGAARIRPLP
jgi:hypothetical protein